MNSTAGGRPKKGVKRVTRKCPGRRQLFFSVTYFSILLQRDVGPAEFRCMAFRRTNNSPAETPMPRNAAPHDNGERRRRVVS